MMKTKPSALYWGVVVFGFSAIKTDLQHLAIIKNERKEEEEKKAL